MTQTEIERAAREYADREMIEMRGHDAGSIGYKHVHKAFLAGAEHAKLEERFRIVQLISNLPDGSITNTTWGEIAKLIEAPEGESK